MCCFVFFSSLILLLSGAVPLALSDQAPIQLTANEHPWGRFKPESYCRMQTTITSQYGEQKITSVQELKTTLISVEKNGITLQEEESVTIGDKIVEKTPKTFLYDFFQELVQEGAKISAGTPTKLMIDKQVVPCEVRIYELSTPVGRQTTTIWYTAQLFPYVMRVEKVLRCFPTDKDPSEQVLSQSVTVVQKTSALKSRGSKRGTYNLQTTEKTGNVTKLTESRCSQNLPGGLECSTTREFDAQGKVIRTLETRLTNYSYSTFY
jgi:hypothetical protein